MTTNSKNGFFRPAIDAVNRLNMVACVINPLAESPLRTCSKIVHRILRYCSDSLVLQPRRGTSRYSCQLSSCHASTTCSHSVRKKRRVNLCPDTEADASSISFAMVADDTNLAKPNYDS